MLSDAVEDIGESSFVVTINLSRLSDDFLFSLGIVDDAIVEDEEDFLIIFTPLDPRLSFKRNQSLLVITDDDSKSGIQASICIYKSKTFTYTHTHPSNRPHPPYQSPSYPT